MNTPYKETYKKKAVSLRLKGLTLREIGEKLSIPTPTIQSWIAQATTTNKKLQKKKTRSASTHRK